MEDLTDPKKDTEAYRLRREEHSTWVDIAKRLGYPIHAWVGCDAILAVARGGHRPVSDTAMTAMPPTYRAAAKRWNRELAA